MVLRAAYFNLAVQLQEAADMSHGNVRSLLSDAVSAAHKGSGSYGYYMDHTGDGETGDVIYSSDGSYMACPYTIETRAGKTTAAIDRENARKVQPMTEYRDVADDDDHYTSMEESFKREGLYIGLPLYERFISKSERDSASEDDFAGKGKSFPILKPEDVSAAVHAMGRAGDKNYGSSGLKSRIIAIAKRKGWTKYLPKAWQDTETTESDVSRGTDATNATLKLAESTEWPQDAGLQLFESAGAVEKEVKIIAPGKGSSAFYSEAALRNSGPKVFRAGTQMFVNHATRQEEAERPEGDWHKLVGALTSDAVYHESHAQGPGLYARARFAANLAPEILEKAKLGAGLSIRASGRQAMEAGRPAVKDGLPVLAEFTSCESVDLVTKAGAGGMILTESDKPGSEGANTVQLTEAELAAVRKSTRFYIAETANREAQTILESMSLFPQGKAEVLRRVLERDIPVKDGALNREEWKKVVEAEAKSVGAFLASVYGTGNVTGMGGGVPMDVRPEMSQKEAKKLRKLQEAQAAQSADVFTDIMGDKRAAQFAAGGR